MDLSHFYYFLIVGLILVMFFNYFFMVDDIDKNISSFFSIMFIVIIGLVYLFQKETPINKVLQDTCLIFFAILTAYVLANWTNLFIKYELRSFPGIIVLYSLFTALFVIYFLLKPVLF